MYHCMLLFPFQIQGALPPTGIQNILQHDIFAKRWMKSTLTTILWAVLMVRTEKTSDTIPALSRAQSSDRKTGMEKYTPGGLFW